AECPGRTPRRVSVGRCLRAPGSHRHPIVGVRSRSEGSCSGPCEPESAGFSTSYEEDTRAGRKFISTERGTPSSGRPSFDDHAFSGQPMCSLAETIALQRRGGSPGRLMLLGEADLRSGSTTSELLRVKRYEFPDAHRWPSRHLLHASSLPVISTLSVQLGHRHQVLGQVLRQPRPFQLPFPFLGGNVLVCDLTVQRVRVLPCDPVHVLRTRTCEFVDPT